MVTKVWGFWKPFRSTTVLPLLNHPLINHRKGGMIRRLVPIHTAGTSVTRPLAATRLEVGFQRSSGLLQQQCLLLLRNFQSASEYNTVADESLENLQGALDDWLDENMDPSASSSSDTTEVVLASGVLTLKLPPHGTWVINKQSATQQIWWSSPLSGPKRFEYSDGAWWSTKDGLNMTSQLAQELQHFFPTASTLTLADGKQ